MQGELAGRRGETKTQREGKTTGWHFFTQLSWPPSIWSNPAPPCRPTRGPWTWTLFSNC